MKLSLRHNLPFLAVAVTYQGKAATIAHVLVDTGSASTILAADALAEIGLFQAPTDRLYAIGGVGGFEINGILGMDFLTQAGAIINLQEMRIEFTD